MFNGLEALCTLCCSPKADHRQTQRHQLHRRLQFAIAPGGLDEVREIFSGWCSRSTTDQFFLAQALQIAAAH